MQETQQGTYLLEGSFQCLRTLFGLTILITSGGYEFNNKSNLPPGKQIKYLSNPRGAIKLSDHTKFLSVAQTPQVKKYPHQYRYNY